jgi:hypothetical protein
MLVRQFVDFNPSGPVFLNRVIPVPCCQEVAGLKGSKNRLGLKFAELKPPFFVEVARKCGCGHEDRHSRHSHHSASRQSRHSCHHYHSASQREKSVVSKKH